jgi:hypothetical protein
MYMKEIAELETRRRRITVTSSFNDIGMDELGNRVVVRRRGRFSLLLRSLLLVAAEMSSWDI